MVNTVRKGNYNQNKARKYLESRGWEVEVARRSMYKGPIDFFSLWDIIAHKGEKFLLIQVKSNYCPPNVKQALMGFPTDGSIVKKEVWVYKDYSRSNPWREVIGNEPTKED